MDVQRNLEANVEKRTKDTFGPPLGKRLIVSIDDMNMPQVSHVPEIPHVHVFQDLHYMYCKYLTRAYCYK